MKIPQLFRRKTENQDNLDQKIKRRNLVSFATFIGLNALAYGSWKWLYNSPRETPGATAGAKAPLRKALNRTELFFRRFFNSGNLVKTYPASKAVKTVRYNGDLGLSNSFKPAEWKLNVISGNGTPLQISLNEIKALPKTQIAFDFKCVEGWDQISYWGGVKFSDFIEHFNLQDQTEKSYVGFNTPDKLYYVGIDMPSAMHPQTLLCYEMSGKTLPWKHGYPLRLIIPVKYGIKNIKRISTITFSNNRPKDYWAERGYDYYSGL